MKILLADKFPSFGVDLLKASGHVCVSKPDLSDSDLPAEVADTEILVVRSTKVTQKTIESAPKLQMIIRAGAGTNTIDKSEANLRKIPVCNVPGRNAVAVAELVMGLIISIDRRIPDNVVELREGRWNKKRFSASQGIYGKSLGVIGVGAIGLAVLERARGFGLRMLVIEKSSRPDNIQKRLSEIGVEAVSDIESLINESHILTFHLPANSSTKRMIDGSFLEKVKHDTVIINTSRGDLIDEQALIRALNEKNLKVGLDVYDNEPSTSVGEFNSELAKHPNVYGTHHIGASTAQAQRAVAEGVIEIVEEFTNGQLLNCVNMPS
ncbi:MAG: hydroxyacid dehydrogenase [Acidiferrobacteraceae bacterium]|nr:hydroxyacid dehydrogenase [Acidiferrobacteraceae bacterium]